MKKLTKLFVAIMLLLLLFVPVVVNAEGGETLTNPEIAEIEDGPLNSFWDAVQDFISSPSWGTLAAIGSALLVAAMPFIWFALKKKLTTITEKLKAKLEIAKAEGTNYKKLYKAYRQDAEVNREKMNALFDGFASMIDAMNLRVDYKDKISATLDKAKELTAEPIELEPIPDIEPEDYDDEDILDNDAVEENNKVGW
jgi:hypothetical protein